MLLCAFVHVKSGITISKKHSGSFQKYSTKTQSVTSSPGVWNLFGEADTGNKKEVRLHTVALKCLENKIQWTFEQYGFELCGSTYTRIFFNIYVRKIFVDFNYLKIHSL